MIVSSTLKGADFFLNLLQETDVAQITTATCGGEARRRLVNQPCDLLIINTPLSDEHGSELALSAAESGSTSVFLVVKSDLSDMAAEKVERAGVYVLAKPLSRQIFYQSYQMVRVFQQKLLRLQEENRKLTNRIEELKLVDRAKCALIQFQGITEAEAHRRIEKQAMNLRCSKGQVAKELLRQYYLP